jgi:2,4-dienoyl-CoA reductase-like NADH-dependent reductase (Old Yellow Enzyme family)
MALKLLEPILIGSSLAKNRIVMAPMETRMSTISGDITQAMIDYYGQRAKGGAGVIIVENTFIDNLASRASLSSSGLYSDHLIAGKNLLAESIQENGTLAIIQLSHGGRQARAGATAYEAVAPSAVMCSVTKRMPHVLTIDEIDKIEDSFAEAAYRAKSAGFDGVEVHGAHGYLICSFLSPLTNLRSDEYGGSLKNRGRFAANILQKIRNKVGTDFIVGYRISASEYIDGGLEPPEACDFVVSVQKNLNYINVSAGIYESPSFWAIASTYVPAGQMVPLARQMKKAVNIPVIAVGSLNPILAEQILQSGDADMIAFGRALIADPFMPKKLAEGRQEDIRPCIRGNEGCISRFYSGCTIRCEVNPACGQEALTLALSGRNVTLLEMTKQIAQKHESGARESLVQLLQRQKVCILTSYTAMEIGAGHIVAKDPDGVAHKIHADTVVLVTGLISRENKELQDIIPKTVCIGDCKEARKIYQCMHEAWNAVINNLLDDCCS